EHSGLNSYGFAKDKNQSITSISASSVQTLSYQWKQIGKFKISNQKNRCIILRNPNEYFIGTLSGMYFYNNDSTFVPSYLNPLSDKEISHLSLDSDCNIWICTRGHGIYLLKKNNQLLHYKNCPAEVVNDLVFVNDSLVFIATSQGVFKNTMNSLFNKMWQRLTDNETHNLAYSNGKLHLAIESGLLVQDLNVSNHESVRKFYLASVIAFDKNIDVNDIRLSYHENSIRFNFDDLSYGSKKKEYAYRLSGSSPDIGRFTGSQLYLQNLSPGYYKLHINAFENNTILDKELIVVSFYIQPAFWQTTIFYILLALLLIGSLIFTYKMVNASERKKTNALQRLASYKMTAIKAQINPHFVSNSLTSIQQLIMANEIDKANLYLAKFSLLLRYVLQQADKYLTPLAEEIKIMDIIVELEQLRFNEKFIYEKKIHPEINLQQTYVPPLLIQPIVENAIWHGLLPLKKLRQPVLTLEIIQHTESLIISISDNGVGRSVHKGQIKTRLFESKGIKLILEWVDNLNKFFPERKVEVHFVDLKDETKEPAGTQVNIVFPIEALNQLKNNKNYRDELLN
ncbi:MAG: hypothetical protein EAY81_10230, partial [Bacteroidetes bacterium]